MQSAFDQLTMSVLAKRYISTRRVGMMMSTPQSSLSTQNGHSDHNGHGDVKVINGRSRSLDEDTSGSSSVPSPTPPPPKSPTKAPEPEPLLPSGKWVRVVKSNLYRPPLKCCSCRKTFDGVANLWAHDTGCYEQFTFDRQCNKDVVPDYQKWLQRAEKVAFACVYNGCFVGVDTLDQLRDHLMTHVDDAPYECRVCYKKFYLVENVTEHLLDAHLVDPWSDSQRVSAAGARVKMQQLPELRSRSPSPVSFMGAPKSNGHDQDEDDFKDSSTVDVDEINQHIVFRGDPKGYSCKLHTCGRVFAEEKLAYVHEPCFGPARTANKDIWACAFGECGKSFETKFLLQQHTGHHLRRCYECRLCGHCFATMAQARQHIKAHSEYR